MKTTASAFGAHVRRICRRLMALAANGEGGICASVRAGGTLSFFAHFRDIDLTGAAFASELRYGASGDSDAVPDVALVVATEDARRGMVIVSIPAAKTALLEPRTYYAEIRATLASGEVESIRLEIVVLPTLF